MNRLQAVFSNPHTSYAGLIAIAFQICQVWAPTSWDAKLDKTSVILLGYASLMAQDGKRKDEVKPTEPTP